MNKEQKAEAVEEIKAALEGSTAVFAVDYRGISVPQAAELRGRLREADASFSVVKNRLAKRAIGDAGTDVLEEHLTGPTALAYVRGDAVLAAKAIADFIKDNETIAYKGGIMDGDTLDPEQFRSIARLPGVDVLRGQLVGVAASPLTGVVRSLNQLIAGLASQLGQARDQGLLGQEAAAEVAADDAPSGRPAPEVAGEPEVEAPDEDAGESDAVAADADPVPEEQAGGEQPEETSDEADASEQAETPEGGAEQDSAPDGDDDESKED